MNRSLNVGVVGATGMVGEIFLKLLEERFFPVHQLKLFASERSQGQKLEFSGRQVPISGLESGCFRGLDLVFFSSGDEISAEWAPRAVNEGAVAVDNSAAFRTDASKLLIVPEVNGHLIPKGNDPILIANPNCSTIQLVVALNPLMKDFGLESVHVATYQAVSGAGRGGQEELSAQLQNWLEKKQLHNPQVFPHLIAMNAIPQIGSFNENGFCSEELKIMRETKKILGQTSLRVSAVTVRIPAWNAHSEAVWVRLKTVATREQIISSLGRQAGLTVHESAQSYPTALNCSGKNAVAIGRIHQDLDDPQSWIFWVVADNLRKGAALNGIQIAERIFDINSTP